MAEVHDRWHRSKLAAGGKPCTEHRLPPSTVHGQGLRWQARYLDPKGTQKAKSFAKRSAADEFLTLMKHTVRSGAYVDPSAGSVTLREYAETWRGIQQHRASSRELVERHLRLYVYPILGARPMGAIKPSEVQAFVIGLGQKLEPSTVRVVYSRLVAIFSTAVRDRIVAISPCERIALPEREPRKVEPLEAPAIWRLVAAAPGRYSALVVAAAGLGLRHGELTGLTVDRVDFLGRRVVVDQQLVTVSHRAPYLGPVKSKKSRRVVPLPTVVAEALAEHIAHYPPGEHGFLFTTEGGRPIPRGTLTPIWQDTVARAGLPKGTRLHDLRHSYASLLIRAGESVVVVSERLGHANAGITLGIYAHLFPDDDNRTRSAIDAALGSPPICTATAR